MDERHGHRDHRCGEQTAAGGANVGKTTGITSPVRWRRFNQTGHRTSEIAAHRKALEETHQEQTSGCPQPDHAEIREQADRGRRRTHEGN